MDHRHIKIIYDDDGRPSGEAFIILDATDKAEQAKQFYNRKTIGHRYIEVVCYESKYLHFPPLLRHLPDIL